MADEATTQDNAGADETSVDTTSTEQGAATDAGTEQQGEAALGDAGKKALDAMKAKWKDADKLARENAAALAALQAKLEGKESEHKQTLEAQRVKDEAIAAANQRILSAEIRAAAKGKVADEALPDLSRLMDLSDIEVGADGEVDASQIVKAIDSLIASKPYLAAQGSRFQGSADGGARNDASQPAQLTRSDMERMSPEQIDAAEKNGQFDRLLGRT